MQSREVLNSCAQTLESLPALDGIVPETLPCDGVTLRLRGRYWSTMQLAAEIVEEGSKTLSPKHISLSLNALKDAPPLSGATQNLFRSALRRLRGLIASSRPGELREAFTPQSLAMIANAYCSLDGVYSADMKEAVSLMSTAALSFEVGCSSPPFAGGIFLILPCFQALTLALNLFVAVDAEGRGCLTSLC